MKRRTLVLASGGALLTACGGGGSSATARIALFGDSLSSNDALPVKTAQILRDALPGCRVDDWTRSSMRASEAEWLLAQVLTDTRPDVVLLLYGGADVIGQTAPAEFERSLRALVATAQARGCRVVLATGIRHPDYLAAVEAINVVIWRIARDMGTAVADVFGLGTGEFQADRVHPGALWNAARAALIADTARQVLP
jgi:hypothetical protein